MASSASYARDLKVPVGGAVRTCPGHRARLQLVAAAGGELGLRAETLDLLAAPAIPMTQASRPGKP